MTMINEERLVHEFIHLVSFDSESYGEVAIAGYLKQQLIELGLRVEKDDAGKQMRRSFNDFSENSQTEKCAGNIYGFLPAYDPDGIYSEGILLSAHMDTVSPGIGKQAIVQRDGRITSDGTTVLGADDGAGLAEILETLRVLQERQLPHPDIEVLFTVAEEPYAQGSRIFDYSKIRAKMAYVLDMSGAVGRAAVAAPSILSLRIHVTGKSAHAGFCPETGIHAIQIAAKSISRIECGHIDGETTVNLGTIQGGTARNIVPDSCEITGEIRSLNHEKALQQAEWIRSIFEEESEQTGGIAKIEVQEEFRGYLIEEQEPVVTRFQQACRDLGLSGGLEKTFGGSDNNHFTSHGIRGIVVANAMNEVHTTKEYTTKEELVRAAELTLKLITI